MKEGRGGEQEVIAASFALSLQIHRILLWLVSVERDFCVKSINTPFESGRHCGLECSNIAKLMVCLRILRFLLGSKWQGDTHLVIHWPTVSQIRSGVHTYVEFVKGACLCREMGRLHPILKGIIM